MHALYGRMTQSIPSDRVALCACVCVCVVQIVSLLQEVSSQVEGERLKAEGMTDIQKLKENNFEVGMPSMVSHLSHTHTHIGVRSQCTVA